MTIGEVTEEGVEQTGPLKDRFLYIDIGSIDRASKRIVGPKILSSSNAPSRAKQLLKTADVLVSMTRPNLNAVALVPPEFNGAIASTGFQVLRAKNSEPSFLYYAVQTPEFINAMCQKVQGALYPAVRPKDIASFILPPFSLEEQRAAVAEIEKQFTRLDTGVASLKRVQTELTRYRASVLKAACEGRLIPTEAELARDENRTYETGEQLLQRILKERREKWNGKGKYKEPTERKPTSHPDLPEGWVWAGFEQLADGTKHAIKAGPFGSSLKKSVYTTTGFKIYGQEQVIRGDPYFGDYFISRELFEQLQSCEAKPGDILMSLVGTAGRVLILPSDCTPGIINPRLLKLSLNRSGVNPMFIKILLESATARAFFKLAAHGGTMEILNLGILKALPVPLPPIAEQTRIIAEVERRLSVIEELQDAVTVNLQRANGLRQSILHCAFEGNLAAK